MDFITQVKMAVYGHFAETGSRPSVEDVSARLGTNATSVVDAFKGLCTQRLLVLEADGSSIRMASPFSGVPTQHIVEANGNQYFGNCAWDALGIVAALHKHCTIHSRCEQSREALHLDVSLDGPESSDWLFHCLVPASKWWDDIVFT